MSGEVRDVVNDAVPITFVFMWSLRQQIVAFVHRAARKNENKEDVACATYKLSRNITVVYLLVRPVCTHSPRPQQRNELRRRSTIEVHPHFSKTSHLRSAYLTRKLNSSRIKLHFR